MSTAHRGLLLAAEAAMKLAGVAAGRVFVHRTRAINSETPYAVALRLVRSTSQLSSTLGGPTDWKSLLQVDCYGRMVGGTPDEASDAIVEAVFAALADDFTLGGAAIGVEPLPGDTLSWDVDELDEKLSCTTAKFLISHRTKGRTLSV
jgi:hypothetical protein